MSNDLLQWLQSWYSKQTNGNWEHSYGIAINTLDNPGWNIEIDLRGTPLSARSFEPTKNDGGDGDWYHCWVKDSKFQAASSPQHLLTVLSIFREWADA